MICDSSNLEVSVWRKSAQGINIARAERCIKPTTDVHVHGTLLPLSGQPLSTRQVRVQVGLVDKRLIVRGLREFRRQLLGGWGVTDPTPVSEVPLDYRSPSSGTTACPTGTPSLTRITTPTTPPSAAGCPPALITSEYPARSLGT